MTSKQVPHRLLGSNGPSVPAIGFGLMGMSSHGTYGAPPSDEERLALLDRAVELGETFWDTSNLYGDNEEFLGKWFKRTGNRNEIFHATKFGYVKGSKTLTTDSSASYCKRACAESLRLLDYLHMPNPETPIEETMRAMVELQAEGKIKHIGLSTVSSTTLRRACKIAPVAAVQIEYSPFTRHIEGPSGTNLLATCRELGVAVVVSSPLGRGLLTPSFSQGQVSKDSQDRRANIFPRFLEANHSNNVNVVNKFKAFADKKGCSVSQLAIAWLLKQGEDILPIPGTRNMEYLEDDWGALDVMLSDEEESDIRAFVEACELAGPPVPEQYMPIIFRDTKEEN